MKKFAALIKVIDSTNKRNLKVEALADYLSSAPDKDKLWTIAILSHRRPKRPVNTTLLRKWASELSGIPLWLFEESYHIVGDLAETIALVIPQEESSNDMSLHTVITEIINLKSLSEIEKKDFIMAQWQKLDYYERFVFNKIITGSFRIGVSQKLMTRALAQATHIDEDVLAYKLMGNWTPQTTTFQELILETAPSDFLSKPYPFYLAHPVSSDFQEEIGDITDWSFEHKWDGIRSQVIIRNGELYVWSRGEELVTDKYPEFSSLLDVIPDGTVIDGEILPFKDGKILNFNDLQKRIGRKNITKSLISNYPVILRTYDILEWKGKDIRSTGFLERREILDSLVNKISKINPQIQLSDTMNFPSWNEAAAERDLSRTKQSEGLMIKRKDSPYLVGRKKGDWWKWKVDPYTIDAVLTYAMRGHGRRANLFTDYTFGLWNNGELVTFAKAYSGLTDKEFRKIDAWIKRNTLERFGPVRSVKSHHVFEIAFEGIAKSTRHKSGVAVRFPRIHRWRKDKSIEEANTLADLKALLR